MTYRNELQGRSLAYSSNVAKDATLSEGKALLTKIDLKVETEENEKNML